MRDAVVAALGARGGAGRRGRPLGRRRAARSPRPTSARGSRALLWPRVGARVAAWRAELDDREPPPRAAVVETPLLFEAGLEGSYDATIAVVADEDLRAARAAARGHAAVDERAARQLSQDEKAQRATFVVVNDGTTEELREALSDILEKLTT